MPIRYYVNLDCTPREEQGEEELLEMLVRRERAGTVQARFKEEYGLTDPERMRFREKRATPSGEKDVEETTVAEVLAECRPLEELASHCQNCPAALEGVPYSCVQSITLPVSEAAEHWLLNQLPPEGSKVLGLFQDAVGRQGYGRGNRFGNWRKARFLKASAPATEERGGFTVSSDQILNEIFLVGDIMPAHGLGVLLHLRALRASDGREGDALLDLLQGVSESGSAEKAPTIEFALKPEREDEASIRELKLFLFAVYTSFSLEVPLALRL